MHQQLRAHGYQAELVSIPFKWYPKKEILAHAAAWRLIDLSEERGDLLGRPARAEEESQVAAALQRTLLLEQLPQVPGVALAALESGRWRIESATFTVHDGPGPSDPLGLLRELRVSDWVTADGRARIEIYPKGDVSDNAALRRFVDAVQAVAPAHAEYYKIDDPADAKASLTSLIGEIKNV